jgi:hypothetical protein
MEDVLASIRRILADETSAGDGADTAATDDGTASPAVSGKDLPHPDLPRQQASAPPPPGPTPVPKSYAAAPRTDADADSEVTLSDDETDIDEPRDETAMPPACPPPSPLETKPKLLPREHEVFMLTPKMKVTAESKLMSAATSESSTDVLAQLAKAMLDRRDLAVGGREATLEDMVRSMLRPLLKEWLDRNLPYIIERLVKKEIDIMVNRAERLED